MAHRVLLVDLEYANALKIKRMIPWKAYDYTLLMEFVDVTGLEKVKLLDPDILILGELRFFNGIKTYMDLIESNGLATNVIILSESDEDIEKWTGYKQVRAVLKRSALDAEMLMGALGKAEDRTDEGMASLSDGHCISNSIEDDRRVVRRFAESMQGSGVTGYVYVVHAARPDAFRLADKKVIEECVVNALRENERVRWFIGSDENLYILTSDREFYNNMISLKMLSKPLQNLIISLGTQLGGGVTLFASENIHKEAFSAKFEKMCKLSGYYYFLADMSIVPEDRVHVSRGAHEYEDLHKIVNEIVVETLKGDPGAAIRLLEELYFERVKPAMNFEMLDFVHACVKRSLRILSFALRQQFEDLPLEQYGTVEAEVEFLGDWIAQIGGVERAKGMNELVVQTILIMNERYMEGLTLYSVATELNISKYYLSRLFKENLGIGFVEYLNEIRIERAKEIILGGEHSVKDVAEKAGFSNTKYFSKVFQDIVKMRPSEFVRELRVRRLDIQ